MADDRPISSSRGALAAAILVGVTALLLFCVGVFLLMRAVAIATEPPAVTAQRPAATVTERLVESPKKFYTPEERLSVVKERLVRFIAASRRKPAEAMAPIVEEAVALGKAYDVNPLLILAVITVESGFNERAVSSAGAKGLMQVHVKVHADKFEPHGGTDAVFDRTANMTVGTQILAKYRAQQGTTAGALKFYVGAGRKKSDGGYGKRVFLEESRLVTAVEHSPERAMALARAKQAGSSFRLLPGQAGDWSDFLGLVRKAPL